jgi:hypothetical protein
MGVEMKPVLSALLIFGVLSPAATDTRPKGLNKDVVLDQLVNNLSWRELSGTVMEVAGKGIRVEDTGSKVVVFDGDRRVATLRKLPGTVSLARKHEARPYKYLIAIRRQASTVLEIASCTAMPLQSQGVESQVVDADLDGVFFEPGDDTLLLYDASVPVSFEGDVWHLDKWWSLSEGVLQAFEHGEQDGWAGLQLLNHCRQLAGLKSVRLDEPRSERAALHANYVVRNWDTPFNHHTEDPLNEWYTEGGARAAKTSLFGYPPSGTDLPYGVAVGSNLDIVYHRRELLNPNLSEVGFGMKPGQGSSPEQVVCIDVGVLGRGPWEDPVVWPADGQLEVPIRFNGLENPMPLPSRVSPSNRGYPVTLIFKSFSRVTSSELHLTLIAPKGRRREIEGFCFGPGREIQSDGSTYAYAYKNNHHICHFIAKSPLVKDAWYEAVGTWVEGGKEHERRWTFRTGRMADTPVR